MTSERCSTAMNEWDESPPCPTDETLSEVVRRHIREASTLASDPALPTKDESPSSTIQSVLATTTKLPRRPNLQYHTPRNASILPSIGRSYPSAVSCMFFFQPEYPSNLTRHLIKVSFGLFGALALLAGVTRLSKTRDFEARPIKALKSPIEKLEEPGTQEEQNMITLNTSIFKSVPVRSRDRKWNSSQYHKGDI